MEAGRPCTSRGRGYLGLARSTFDIVLSFNQAIHGSVETVLGQFFLRTPAPAVRSSPVKMMIARGGARASVAMSAAPGLLPTGMTAHGASCSISWLRHCTHSHLRGRAANAAYITPRACTRRSGAANAKTDTPFSA